MKAAVVTFPGSNCDRDLAVAFTRAGFDVTRVWHKDTAQSDFTSGYAKGQQINVPIAHHDGNYTIDAAGLALLRGEDRIAFTYAVTPNGAMADIAGVLSENRRVLGMMPHPERVVDASHGGTDGATLFASLMGGMALA